MNTNINEENGPPPAKRAPPLPDINLKAIPNANTLALTNVNLNAVPIANANLYAPTMMVAERAADLIQEKTPLAPEYVDWFKN